MSAWTVGALAATVVLGVGAFTVWILAAEGLALSLVVALVVVVAGVTLAARRGHRPHPPTCSWRVTSRNGSAGSTMSSSPPCSTLAPGRPSRAALAAAAVRAVEDDGLTGSFRRRSCGAWRAGATAATLALAVGATAFAPTAGRGAAVLAAYLRPARLSIEVTPGSAKVREGQPVTITARLHGVEGGLNPDLVLGEGEGARVVRMSPQEDGTYAATIDAVRDSFPRSARRSRAIGAVCHRGHSPGASPASTCAIAIPPVSAPSRASRRTAAISSDREGRRSSLPSAPTSR